jgi:predicted DNA-binding transcriptional regulator AlpA
MTTQAEYIQMSPKASADLALSLDPDEIFRPARAKKYFGYGISQLYLKVKTGEIPAPIKLSASGSAVGWLGSQIIAFHRTRLALTKQKAGDQI